MKPKISFIAPSHRTQYWHNFYNSIVTNLDFEVIFVTDIEPKEEEDPSRILTEIWGEKRELKYLNNDKSKFKWIFSKTKPAQCFEIAYRQAKGDFIIWTGDDFIYSPYALDHAYNLSLLIHNRPTAHTLDEWAIESEVVYCICRDH